MVQGAGDRAENDMGAIPLSRVLVGMEQETSYSMGTAGAVVTRGRHNLTSSSFSFFNGTFYLIFLSLILSPYISSSSS